jgi:ornithine cyclodeaminase/alanine dehydrogenase-like protein (mu-crystallin family)
MANARYLDANDLAALLPPKDSAAVLAAALARPAAASDWKRAADGKAPAGSSALLRGGAPALLVDTAAFEARRGAAAALLVAARLGDPRTEVITLLGCNATGRAFMEGAVTQLPDLQRMLCYDPNIPAQNAFADGVMTELNVASIIPTDPREAVEGAQLLVNCLQPTAAKPFVEPDWLQRGTTCVLLDGTETFTTATIAGATRRTTDDLAAWRAASARLPGVAEPEGDLAALAAGKLPPRSGTPLIIAVHFGSPAVDAALATELLARAEAANRGKQVAL